MKSRTYYGEYSLMHWVNMMLSQEITLPEYQRSFVWGEKEIRRLISSLQEAQFIQPVTIAQFKDDNGITHKNLILDGQQRLTSVLLAYIGYMPDLSKYVNEEEMASEDDGAQDEESSTSPSKKPKKWTFVSLLGNKTESLAQIRARLHSNEKYKEFKIDGYPEDAALYEEKLQKFYNSTFIGFSYIVPETSDAADIQGGYTRLFRAINYFGVKLSILESRRSLYFKKQEYQQFFEGQDSDGNDVLCDLTVFEKMEKKKIDFVRYLSTLSQYFVESNSSKVLKWYSAVSSREAYYADYVSYILEMEQEDNEHKFDGFDFNTVFSGGSWKERYVEFKRVVQLLKPSMGLNEKEAFVSIIDADYWLYGLFYHVVFKGKTLAEDNDRLLTNIKSRISAKKSDPVYSKSPNRLGNLRDRIQDSISIYSSYVH